MLKEFSDDLRLRIHNENDILIEEAMWAVDLYHPRRTRRAAWEMVLSFFLYQ